MSELNECDPVRTYGLEDLPGVPLTSGFIYLPADQVPTAELSDEATVRYQQSLKEFDESQKFDRTPDPLE